ncbi:YjcZ family sporulation protein [Lysinibacillus agricola]|uniref:YjcZ family sporulation protein n=1 Tax=Lysinibacillus agricola TaxID=2590012 RepID=A0ABX7AWJ5_9BACI|nr:MULTISPECIES: YjcZ family sporulation protein [Lysinibacillus]QQP14353.1 YjcZ family sporulation protein [Lysinibacillus agricola]
MGYYGNIGNFNNCYSCGCDGGYRRGPGSSFALLVVLFILLIIIGATFINREHC